MTFTFDDFGNPEATRTGYAPFGDQQTWYRITGTLESPGPPMIAVHGGPGASHDYISPLSQLALSGRPIIHYDQIGCGNSSSLTDEQVQNLTVDFFLDELENLIDHLQIADDFIVLAHLGRHDGPGVRSSSAGRTSRTDLVQLSRLRISLGPGSRPSCSTLA